MNPNRDEILKTLGENRQTINGFGVKRLGLFGSCARGEQGGSSDLDFVVEFEENSFDAYMDLKVFLEQLFECNIDLVLIDTIKPRLKQPILKETVYVPGL